jgi:hypothetical protein
MSPRTRAVVAASLSVGAIALAGACVQTQRALGEDCLKDQDCLSGICSQLQCAAAPPLLDGAAQAPPGEAGSDDAVADVAVDSSPPDAPPDAPPESAPPGGDAGDDAAGDDSATDAAVE